MKFLLLNAHASIEPLPPTAGTTQQKIPWAQPLGLLYIGGMLENQGHSVDLIDFVAEDFSEETIKKYLSSVDAIGISVDSIGHTEAATITRTIKQIDNNLPVIIGGPHCSFYPEKSLSDLPSADISVEGEGEQVILAIIEALHGTKPLSDIAGIRYRKNGEIKVGKPPEIITDLDAIPFPARHLVTKYDYGKLGKRYLYKPRFTSIATTRGCPFQCRFCTRHIVGMNNFRQRSVENILEELTKIDDDGYSSVMIVDDNFLTDSKRVHHIVDQIISQGIDLDIIIQGSRVDTADEDLYRKLKKAGVKAINFGIESGNQDILDYYHKQITLDQITKAVNLSHTMGFLTVGNFILGAPIETESHIRRTIRFACSLSLDFVSFTILRYNYHSDLWNEAFQEGKIPSEDCYSILSDSRKGLGNFTQQELETYEKKGLKTFYLRPRYVMQQLVRTVRTGDFTTFKTLSYSVSHNMNEIF